MLVLTDHYLKADATEVTYLLTSYDPPSTPTESLIPHFSQLNSLSVVSSLMYHLSLNPETIGSHALERFVPLISLSKLTIRPLRPDLSSSSEEPPENGL